MTEKIEDNTGNNTEVSKDILKLKIRFIRKLFYFGTILLIIVYIFPYLVPYIYPELTHDEIISISIIVAIITAVYYGVFLIYIIATVKKFTHKKISLVEKMMRCKLRIENGLDYCVKCPDSYTCASEIDKN